MKRYCPQCGARMKHNVTGMWNRNQPQDGKTIIDLWDCNGCVRVFKNSELINNSYKIYA